jgi:nitrite reductase (NO-forming)
MPTATARPSHGPKDRPAPPRGTRRRAGALAPVGAVLAAAVLGVLVSVAVLTGGNEAPAATETVAVEMDEFSFAPAVVEVEAGTELVVRATNTGLQTHDLKIRGETGTGYLMGGEREEVSLGVIDEDTKAWCTVPGHLEAGMVMDIVVTPPDEATTR